MPDASLWSTAAWEKAPLSQYLTLEGRDATFSQWLHWTAVAFRQWTSGGVGSGTQYLHGVAQLHLLSATGGGGHKSYIFYIQECSARLASPGTWELLLQSRS